MKIEKRKLQDWELAECRALKEALADFNRSVIREKKITQEMAAGDLNITQGALSSFLNGRNALTLKVAAYFSRALNLPISEFSKRLAEEADLIGQAAGPVANLDKAVNRSFLENSELDTLLQLATPRTQTELLKIAQAAADGRLTEDDIKLLKVIADRLAKKD